MRSEPEFLKVWTRQKNLSFFGEEKDPKKIAIRQAYEDKLHPIGVVESQYSSDKNKFLIETLKGLITADDPSLRELGHKVFENFVRRAKFSSYKMAELPQTYYDLIDLAHMEELTEREK